MNFASRQQAGRLLGRRLLEQSVSADLVLGLPRGGVVVAAEVARALGLPFDAILVRKIGHPQNREFAVGALAEQGVVLYDQAAPLESKALEREVAAEAARLLACRRQWEMSLRPTLRNRRLVLVDDGLATGATMEAAVRSARFQRPRRIIVAVPVASASAVARLQWQVDEVVALVTDPLFRAVGSYYQSFEQTDDEEVMALLAQGRQPVEPPEAGAELNQSDASAPRR
jgi:putative phosphoribosyl transferase